MSAELFDNLNTYSKLEVVSADSAENLLVLIRSIRTKIHIVNIYAEQGRHYAWIHGNVVVRREPVKKKTKKKGIDNG